MAEKNCREWGFDLTEFGTKEKFSKLLKRHGLTKYKKRCDREFPELCKFEWRNKDISITTGNNPITGEFSVKKQRSPEKGYASYIGISGDPKKVKNLASDIKKTAEFIKDESRCEREFI